MRKSDNLDNWFEFSTERMDVLGQAVCKSNGKVSFILKALPDERGKAQIFYQKKNWQRAIVKNPSDVTQKSNLRINPECSHYNNCFGCHYLHTNYKQELVFKEESLRNHLRKFELPQITVVASEKRFAYRNRLQLHYDLKEKKLGLNGPYGITEIPDCLLPVELLAKEIAKFYNSNWWEKTLFEDAPSTGHIEFYITDFKQVSIAINKPYAHLGFTQVNSSMNDKLIGPITEQFNQLDTSSMVLDLFGGNGNLSAKLNCPTLVCDGKTRTALSHQTSLEINLYKDEALKIVEKKIKGKKISGMIVDPPRGGFIGISNWVNHFMDSETSRLIYVSCSPDTLARDLEELSLNSKKFRIAQIFLFDMFPGTHHFETLVVLKN